MEAHSSPLRLRGSHVHLAWLTQARRLQGNSGRHSPFTQVRRSRRSQSHRLRWSRRFAVHLSLPASPLSSRPVPTTELLDTALPPKFSAPLLTPESPPEPAPRKCPPGPAPLMPALSVPTPPEHPQVPAPYYSSNFLLCLLSFISLQFCYVLCVDLMLLQWIMCVDAY